MIYHNFFSVCSLIPAFFMLACVLTILLMPKKSKATIHLGMAFLYMTLFFFSYFVAASLYHPYAAYHRWMTVFVVTLCETHLIIFNFYFPDERNTSFAKWLLIALYSISLSVTVIFMVVSSGSGKIYHFAGHYWDFDEDVISKVVAFLVILYLFTTLFTGLWRTVVTKSKKRWAVLSINVAIFLTILVPAVTNALSRDGMLDRGTYQITQDLFNILGFFVVNIIYINTSKDRSNFMIKILGICFATFLIVFQGLSYFSLKDLDNAYDALKKKDLKLALGTDEYSDDLEYLISYSVETEEIMKIYSKNQVASTVDFNNLRNNYYNTFKYEEINYLNNYNLKDFKQSMGNVLNTNSVYFHGYEKIIKNYINALPLNTLNPAEMTLAYIKNIEKQIKYLIIKIKKIPTASFSMNLNQILKKSPSELSPLTNEIIKYSKKFKSSEIHLKNEILKFLAPMKEAGVRNYRRSAFDKKHFNSFMFYDPDEEIVYEAGFNYIAYREFHHPTSLKFIYMLGGILLVIFFGFQLFFRGAFIKPIKELLMGMKKITRGKYDVTIPVQMQDELGYITFCFNLMAETLNKTKQELADYTVNLEKKVEGRTIELKEARDALWGEMKLASKMQVVLLPKEPFLPGYEIDAFMQPAELVGGDYYDVINFDDNSWVMVGDVSGHGVPAGLIMMMVQTAIRSIVMNEPSIVPSKLLDKVVKSIGYNMKNMLEQKFMTISTFNFQSDGSVICSGRHEDILIYRKSSNSVKSIKTVGICLSYWKLGNRGKNIKFKLDKGDVLLLYTDGITEARDPDGNLFGMKKLIHIFKSCGNENVTKIKDTILNELKGYQTDDDVTILALKKN